MNKISQPDFAEYMREALYGETGFYTLGNGAGRQRDYMTSPEVGDLFGYVVAGYIDKWFQSLDDQSHAVVLEVGCGPGSLAASIARAGLKYAEQISYCLVDISETNRETAQKRLVQTRPLFEWEVFATIPELDSPTLVISNELLDNLVFNIGYFEDVYKGYEPDEHVRTDNETYAYIGQFRDIDILKEASVPKGMGGFRIPLHVGITQFFEELLSASMQVTDLSLLMFDYMKSVTQMSDEQWLRLYTQGRRIVGVDDVLTALESGITGDITTDVTKEDLFVILEAEGFSNTRIKTQAEWLEANLIDSYCELSFGNQTQSSGYDIAQQFVSSPTHGAQQGFAKEREILMDPAGLGAFSVLQSRRAI